MELTVPVEQLRKYKVYIASPMYGGQCAGVSSMSVMGLQKRLLEAGMGYDATFIFNESLVPRARNNLAAKFLTSDCTHLVFLDSDIRFNPDDILFMLAMEKDVIGAPYAKKSIDWLAVREAVKKYPEISPQEMACIASTPVLGFLDNGQIRLDQPAAVREIGTGVLVIRREVIEKLVEAHPELRYETMGDEENVPHYDLFQIGQFRRNGEPKNYLSEDYWFCALWRELGGEIYLCPWMQTGHVGTIEFPCDLVTSARILGVLSPAKWKDAGGLPEAAQSQSSREG